MKLFSIFFLGFLVSILCLFSCEKNPTEPLFPPCVRAKVDSIILRPVNFKPAELWLWKINGVNYYLLTSECCDEYNYLYDEDCAVYCAPTGGDNDQGNGSCQLQGKKIRKTLLWKDTR